jgi:hypothetical protein
VTPLIVDVTNAAQIQDAVEKVESLDLLINNAGLALYDDLSDRAAIEQSLAVNFFGPYGVTQAFLPLLIGSRGSRRQQRLGHGLGTLAAHSGLRDLEGGGVQHDSIPACSSGGTGRKGPCRADRPHRHRYDPRVRDTEGLSGVRRTSHLRRGGERGGGHLPRSHDGAYGGELAQRAGQGDGAPERGVRKSSEQCCLKQKSPLRTRVTPPRVTRHPSDTFQERKRLMDELIELVRVGRIADFSS